MVDPAIEIILTALERSLDQTYASANALPAGFYTDPDFLQHEIEQIFYKEWVCIGRVEEAPNPGDYWTFDLLGEPLLVVRDDAQQLRVLANVCRHRGMPVMTGSGQTRQLLCPYHNWSYDLSGQLQRTPLLEPRADFNRKDCRLPEVSSTVWNGFLFVNLDAQAKPLAPRLVGLESLVKNYHMEQMQLHLNQEETWPTNWKCLTENFMEGYHLSTVHYETLHPITPTRLCEHFPAGEGYFGYFSHYPGDLPQRGTYHPDVTAFERGCSVMFAIPPSFVAGVGGHMTNYVCLQPKSVDNVHAKLGLTYLDNDAPVAKKDETADFFLSVMAEDKVMLERLQRGLHSRFYQPGPLASINYEGNVLDFYHYLARQLACKQVSY